eukprot:COSAG06_NODE_61117_length_268_cov_1.840237_1_plen_78_part_01
MFHRKTPLHWWYVQYDTAVVQTRCGDKYPPDLAGMRHQIDRAASDLLRCVELARVWLQKQKKAELKRKKSERAMQKRE